MLPSLTDPASPRPVTSHGRASEQQHLVPHGADETQSAHSTCPYDDGSSHAPETAKGASIYRLVSDPGRAGQPKRSVAAAIKAWLPEVLWCLTSVLLFIALITILHQYDGRSIPQWPLGLTLNTLVAAFATLCRAASVVPVTEGISQLKWNYFVGQQRPLRDLYLFDQASRGPWGSVHLLGSLRGRIGAFVTPAALVLVTGLGTSFITQSAVSYSNELAGRPHDGAVVRAAPQYPDRTLNQQAERDIGNDIVRAASQAALNPVSEPWPMPEPRCPSSHCSWPEYRSLAVCTTIANVTEHLEWIEDEIDSDWLVALPDNLGYMTLEDIGREMMTMTSPEPPAPDFSDMSPNMTDEDRAAFLASNYPIIRPSLGIEILFHFCVNTYNITYHDGAPQTTLVASKVSLLNTTYNETGPHYSLVGERDEELFDIHDVWDYSMLDEVFRRDFAGGWSSTYSIDRASPFLRQIGINLYDGVDRQTPVMESDERMWRNILGLTGNIADSMTAYMRSTGRQQIQGEAFFPVTILRVRWEWLTFLAVQLVLTVVFLVSVIINTERMGVDIVKSSNMAELFALHIGEAEDSVKTGGISSSVDRKTAAELYHGGQGWKLKIQ
ncbi:hypothetical protein B0I35DRAFT_512755 [Stachybotrys elegans]|uniref:Uncharacterized protein n=1 Tax=Stachybotrys elegans TaxID=80388 RepID=A0A8K0SQD6_9HYPO|nr:hypothetical protein B0I35DRAFT_512755 [Stachybotrys elegans]